MEVSFYSPINMPISAEGIENTNDRRNELIKTSFEKLRRRRTALVFASCFRQFRSTTIFRVENRLLRSSDARFTLGDRLWPMGLNFCPILFFWDVRMGYF